MAIGGHADGALETLDKALAIDPRYPPAYLYRGQVLFEQKQDYAGAVKSWQQFLALVLAGEDHDRVAQLVETAKSKQQSRWEADRVADGHAFWYAPGAPLAHESVPFSSRASRESRPAPAATWN